MRSDGLADAALAPGAARLSTLLRRVQIIARSASRCASRNSRCGSEEHDLAAVLAGTGTDVEHAVGGLHDLGIVLDDDQRVAGIAQPLHDADDAADVARMQADARARRARTSVLTSEVPSAVVRLIRCTSPPESVRDWRSRFR